MTENDTKNSRKNAFVVLFCNESAEKCFFLCNDYLIFNVFFVSFSACYRGVFIKLNRILKIVA